jgi:hypothetical protein
MGARSASRSFRQSVNTAMSILVIAGAIAAGMLLVVAPGCSSDDDTVTGPQNTLSHFSATIDGSEYEATWNAYAVWITDPMPTLTINGLGPAGTDTCLVSLSLDTKDVGTYTLMPGNMDKTASAEFRPGNRYFATFRSGSHGTVHLTSNSGGRVTGTFEFVACAPAADSIVVSDGSFNVPLTVSP